MSVEWPDDDPAWDEMPPGSNSVVLLMIGNLVQRIDDVTDEELDRIRDAIQVDGIISVDSFNGWINASHVLMVTFPEGDV